MTRYFSAATKRFLLTRHFYIGPIGKWSLRRLRGGSIDKTLFLLTQHVSTDTFLFLLTRQFFYCHVTFLLIQHVLLLTRHFFYWHETFSIDTILFFLGFFVGTIFFYWYGVYWHNASSIETMFFFSFCRCRYTPFLLNAVFQPIGRWSLRRLLGSSVDTILFYWHNTFSIDTTLFYWRDTFSTETNPFLLRRTLFYWDEPFSTE